MVCALVSWAIRPEMKLDAEYARKDTPIITPTNALGRQTRDHGHADRRQAQLSGDQKQKVEREECERHLARRVGESCAERQNEEREAAARDRQGELERRPRLASASPERDPERTEDGGQYDHVHRWQGLQRRGRDLAPEDHPIHQAVGEEIQRTAHLLVECPEADREQDQHRADQ